MINCETHAVAFIISVMSSEVELWMVGDFLKQISTAGPERRPIVIVLTMCD